MGYMNPFGGSSVQPSTVAYRAVTLAANTTLVWPAQSQSATDFVARLMDVTASSAGLTMTMPDATAVSAGFDLLLTNPGANTYTVADNAGGTICTVAAGTVQYLYLKGTGTAAGVWSVLQFGSLSSAVAAASLVGPGIKASGSALYAAETVSLISANTTLTTSDRTSMFVWNGGVGTITMPTAVAAGNDYFFSVANQGTGALSVACAGSDTLDGSSAISLLIGESCVIHSAGGANAWYTVGRGRNTQFNFTLLSKAVTTGTYTLTSIEAANVVQKYTGALTGNVIVVVPSTVQVYYVSNQTTNAFSLTFKTSGVGGTITVPQGQNAVLACDGLNVINTATTVSGISSLTLAQGSVGGPSINYSGDPSTGFYQPVSSTVAVSIAGTEALRIDATGNVGIGTSTPTLFGGGYRTLEVKGTTTGNGGMFSAISSDGSIGARIGAESAGATVTGVGATTALRFVVNSAERMRILTSAAGGKDLVIGGTTAPFAAANRTTLTLAGVTDSLYALDRGYLWGDAGGNKLELAATGATTSLAFVVNGAQRMTISPTGAVAIGGTLTAASFAGIGAALTGLPVMSVFGRSGAITANTGDYTFAQIGSKPTTLTGYGITDAAPAANPTFTGAVNLGTNATINGAQVGYRDMVASGITTGTLSLSDVGLCVYASGAVTVPNGVFSKGHTVSVYNDTAGSISLGAGITTLRLGGTATTGARTLASRGLALIHFISGSEAVVFGTGVT
jgi:hypothetical protein